MSTTPGTPGNTPQPDPGASGGQEPADSPKGYKPPASQDELDRIIRDRLAREQAKYADYADLKTKAAEWEKAQEASKTEAQKQADALAKLQAENRDLKVRSLRAEVASAKGVPVGLLTGTTREEIEVSAAAALEWRGQPVPKGPPATGQGQGSDPGQGKELSAAEIVKAARGR
jgi:hypothetical protein